MSALQAWKVTEVVARRLGVEVDPGRRASILRGLDVPAEESAWLSDGVIQAGAQVHLAYLERAVRADDVLQMLKVEAYPFVLFEPAGEVGANALVVLEAAAGGVAVVRVASDGSAAEGTCTPAELTGGAGDGSRTCLVPVSLGPYVGRAGQVADRADRRPTPLQRLLQLLARERRDIGLVYLYATLTGLLSLVLPLAVQMIVGMVQGGLILQPVVILIAFVILGTLASGGLQLMQLSVVELIQQRIFARLALEFGFKVPRLRLEETIDEDLPEVMNRFFETITIQKSLSKLLTESTTALLQVVFGLILLTFYHPYFTAFGLFLLGGLWLIFAVTGPKGLETSLKESSYKYKVVHWLEEMARAITAFKFAGRSQLPVRRMDELVTGYLRYRKKHFSVVLQQGISIVVFKTTLLGGLLILGTVLVVNRQISLGQFVASEIVIVTVLAGLEKLILSIATVYDLLTAVEKAGHVSDLPVEDASGLPVVADRGPGFEVAVRNLTYTYPGAAVPTLMGIDLTLRPGERVGIIGFDGSGQSTLLRVLTGLLDNYTGSIAYNGLTLRDLDRGALRDRIGQLLSLTDLFEGTIEENVSVGRAHVRTAEVIASLEQVGVFEHVQALPHGLRTAVPAGGKTLPVSVLHKLLLAQAIAGRPKLLILEDIFQNLDAGPREEIVAMLTARDAGWTLLVATHDPAFLTACDRVCVLQEGRIVAEGTYDELASTGRLHALVPALRTA
jgi:ABC-type bacteriocin/lantibiotic exporter with double-glycine peptidase domain